MVHAYNQDLTTKDSVIKNYHSEYCQDIAKPFEVLICKIKSKFFQIFNISSSKENKVQIKSQTGRQKNSQNSQPPAYQVGAGVMAGWLSWVAGLRATFKAEHINPRVQRTFFLSSHESSNHHQNLPDLEASCKFKSDEDQAITQRQGCRHEPCQRTSSDGCSMDETLAVRHQKAIGHTEFLTLKPKRTGKSHCSGHSRSPYIQKQIVWTPWGQVTMWPGSWGLTEPCSARITREEVQIQPLQEINDRAGDLAQQC